MPSKELIDEHREMGIAKNLRFVASTKKYLFHIFKINFIF
jgi:hypothetical protein